ncbi:BMP family lipoprotein [Treponema brennaborense]|uniref:Basic membrane lipoprotein n=1 Tax=Treponema brennaborense (strain DSM 12168 / CIP 105900 / DD5/3) TaxID=906968 RepID=F4LM11_TREBD|nr:BMP family protein [Treponema brennaborense]AEE16690.1 basic membrane lipoprotein [Treponema brennaborense DSM 12168]
MKKFVLILAVLILAAGIVFAGGKKDAASADGRPTVRLITDATGIDDKSFNAAAWRGILAYYGDTWEKQTNRGKLYDVVTCQTQDMYIPTLKQASDEGYDLIVTTGFTFADALTEVSQLYPDQRYMIVDVDWIGQPNVMEAIFTKDQGSYLVGVAAALQAKAEKVADPKFGFIGGVPGATITKFEVGYIQGIKSVFPNAPIVDFYANDWGKPELAKAQAKNWYDSGVYAIFSAAGGTGNGTIAQAKEYRIQGKNVWAIGVDSDQYEDGLYSGTQSAVLTSMVKRVESATKYALECIAANTFKGGVVSLDMAGDGVGFSTANPALSADVVKQVEAAKADIINGKIKVIGTYKEALAAGKVPAGLGAKDN